jgi:hypothetical protein
VNDSIAPTEDPRKELERLRKLKRLRELQAKAGGSAPAAQPESFAANRTVIDDEEDFDIDALINEAASQVPGGYNAWKNGFDQKTGADGRRVVPGVGKETAPGESNFFVNRDEDLPVMQRKAPAPTPKPQQSPGTQNWPTGGDRAVSGYDALKESGVRGDLAGRVLGSAGNAVIGGLDLLSEPGRWADDAVGSVAPWWPSLAWDDQGFRLETAGSMDEQEKGYGGVGRIPMSEAKDDAEGMADMAGEALGFVVPGMGVNKAMRGVGAVANKAPGVASAVAAISPKGADAGARLGRYGQRMLSTIPEAGVQAAAFGASTADQAIIDDGYIVPGEDPMEKAAEFAGNPLSYFAPLALSGIYRGGVAAMSGGKSITPKAVQAQVAPHMLSATDQAVAALGDLPIPSGISGKDADRALTIMHKALSSGSVPDDVMSSLVKKYNETPGNRPPPAVFLRDELRQMGYAKGVENLDNAIYEIGQKAPEVGNALRDMRMTQAERLNAGLNDTLGAGDRVKVDRALTKKMKKLGAKEYEPIIARGPVDAEAAMQLKALLNDKQFWDAIPKGYKTKLSMAAIDPNPEAAASTLPAGRGQSVGRGSGPDMVGGYPMREKIALQQRIEENPLEVAHKLYSSLGKKIRGRKDLDGSLQELQDAIRDPLFKAGGKEYVAVNSKYKKASDQRRALTAPDKLFAESLKSHEIARVEDAVGSMSAAELKNYKISAKGILQDELKRAKINNDFVQLGRMKREGALDAFGRILGDDGKDLVRQIRDIVGEQDAIVAFDPANKTNSGDRLAKGREAYAGKTGALEHTGRYEMKDILVDAGISYAASGFLPLLPLRGIYRGGQKLFARMATPNPSARRDFARVALERPNAPGRRPVDPRVEAARKRRQDAAKAQYRKNGKFGGKAEFLDPEAPGPRTAGGFDDEGFARSMTDKDPLLPDDGSGGAALTVIDDGYEMPPPSQKRLPNGQKLIAGDRTSKPREDEPEAPKSAAERYVEELRARKKELEDKLDAQAREKQTERGRLRESERVANDAERLRAREEALKTQSKSEGLRIERLREQELAAVERARKAAQWADDSDALGPPEVKDGPFQKLGRVEDRWRAPAGDPRSLRDAMKYLVGEGERAAVSNNLRRFGRDSELEWYNSPEINRANELLRAAQGQKEGISPEVMDIVGKLNGANKKWLAEQLAEPQQFDLVDLMMKIDNLPQRGTKELQYAAEGPIAAIGGGIGAAALGGKALYDSREKRTPEQIEADRRRLYGEDTGDEMFDVPDAVEIRKMQAALNALGITDRYGQPLKTDGAMGDRFREAISDFADRNGLQVHPLNPGGLSKNIVAKLREYDQ